MNDEEHLAAELDSHLRALRNADTQPTAIAWMKTAYQLMERASDNFKRPRVFSVPGHFGAPTFMLRPPKALELPTHNPVKPLGFFDPRVKTVVYGDKFTTARAWTRSDTRRMERESAALRQLTSGK